MSYASLSLSTSDGSDVEYVLCIENDCPPRYEGARGWEEEALPLIDGRPSLHSTQPRTRHKMLMCDYFAEVSTYLPRLFHRWYWMRIKLFVMIVEACEANCHFFTCQRNATGLLSFRPYQKISASMRMIAYGIRADYTDEYLWFGEDTTLKCVRILGKVIIRLFGPTYLLSPNEEDKKRLMLINEKRGCLTCLVA
jgi:hypothetical protein